jgi:hypothetical protein
MQVLLESDEDEFTTYTAGRGIQARRLSTCSAVTVDDLMSQLNEPLSPPSEWPYLYQAKWQGMIDPSAAFSMLSCSPPDLPFTGTYQPGLIQTAHLSSEAETSHQKILAKRERDRKGN